MSLLLLSLPLASFALEVPTKAVSSRRGLMVGGLASLVPAIATAYDLPDLPYPYEALEPSIDAATMKIHHDKHHATYVAGINNALDKDQPPIADLMKGAIKGGVKGVRNSGGGVYNHDFFWQAMAPKGKGGDMSKELTAAIDKKFGSVDKFKEQWAAASMSERTELF